MRFRDREQAGELLAAGLERYRDAHPVVLALPRGGVPVAARVAVALRAPLDVVVARKIGAPGNPEFALGAVTARGATALNERVLRQVFLPPGYLDRAFEDERRVAESRERELRGVRPRCPLSGRVAILVDDGVATGMTMRAAIQDVRVQGPAEVVVAAPVIAPDTYRQLCDLVDDVVALEVPEGFLAVGGFYEHFEATTDAQVRELLVTHVAR